MKARRSAAPPAPAPVPADPPSAHVLSGRYRLGRKIGSGGMADVYEGVDTRLRRPVAVKVFRPGSDPQNDDRLAAEAVLLARLQHPGLVTVHDAGRHDDRAYLVMELVNGPTLRSLLAGGALPLPRVADLGTALARALAHVHRAGIVHRDIKPSNILLDTAGSPHLADFGIARLANSTRRTAPDALTGTAAYLAPEQVEGRPVGPATDVYALGLVLLECLKGELEYPGTPLEAALARLHRPPAVPAWCPFDLAALLRAMTARDPETRPDAEQCARALSSSNAGRRPSPLPSPPAARLPAPPAARPGADEPVRTQEVAVTRPGVPGGTRHSRRLAVGTALAALSVALGTTLAVAPAVGGDSDERADLNSTATTPAHPSSGTALPRSGPSAVPPAGSPARPASRTVGASGPAASTGFPAGSASRSLGPSDRAAPAHGAPARHHGAAPRKRGPHHPRDTDDHTRHAPHGAPQPPAQADGPQPYPTHKDSD
ncbi:protein kinase [Streptomyces sp. NPDC046759]|uniref:serine/threonine-protein kinase n=1 Tax=Streptomyces sp. NPDC046759 TaxID=3155019 RepID=UPI0033ECBB6A